MFINKMVNQNMKFALFEDCLHPELESSYYFSCPVDEVLIYQNSDVGEALEKIEQLSKSGLYLAGYVAYTMVDTMYEQLNLSQNGDQPLLHFVAYQNAQKFASNNLSHLNIKLPWSNHEINFDFLELNLNYSEYLYKFNQVQNHLRSGDSYQLNLTLPVSLETNNSNLFALYYQLSRSHPVAYASYLPFVPQSLISISPELFFKKNEDNIFVRPMKGTMPRGTSVDEDRANAKFLMEDVKNRAENLIIVDLLRNDLAKFCTNSSVKVTDLFKIEQFQSLFQMTSTIYGNVPASISFATILEGLFPCGSITGAPKLRTMQLIESIEGYNRGAYSGTIGYILPNNNMCFSVSIRTLSVNHEDTEKLTLGVGGGITVKSNPSEEWSEINTKLRFIRKFYHPSFSLIESFLVLGRKIINFEAHLQRLSNSAEKLGFCYSGDAIKYDLETYILKHCIHDKRYKLRLKLNVKGKFEINHILIGENPALLHIALYPVKINTQHGLFLHKTDSIITRGLYTKINQDHKPELIDELIFMNQDCFITESRYYNVIIDYDGILMTPPVLHGLLPGIYRQQMLDTGKLIECGITMDMLMKSNAIYLCNDVRGLIKCKLIKYTTV